MAGALKCRQRERRHHGTPFDEISLGIGDVTFGSKASSFAIDGGQAVSAIPHWRQKQMPGGPLRAQFWTYRGFRYAAELQCCRYRGVDTEEPMLFMVIERFIDDDILPIYKRLRDGGRMLPDGLKYIDSWVEPNLARCFQLMECDDLRLFQEWVLMWRGSGVTLEIVPVVSSKDTCEVVAPHLDKL
jgi:hypothetical protein